MIVIAPRERSRHLALDSFGTGGPCYPLFGSGSAGLGFPISRPLAACCVCLEPRPLPSTGITRLQQYCEPLNPIRCGRLSVSRPSSARRLRSEDARPLALNDDELAALMDCA